MSRLPTLPKKFFDVKSKFLPKGKLTLSPFTVGLENLLIQVKDAEDEKEKMAAVKQVVQECVQTPNVDVTTIPMFALEEIFVRLRQNSIGEIVEQQYQCTADKSEGVKCNTTMPVQIDLREFKIIEPEGHVNAITVSDPIGIKFRYPSISLLEEDGIDTTDEVETIISCIESIYDAENVYPAADHTREDLKSFWNQLTLLQKKEVFEKFFQTIPHLHYKKALVCKGCGHEHNIEFNSMQELFQ